MAPFYQRCSVRSRRLSLLAGVLGRRASTVGSTARLYITVDELDDGHRCVVAVAESRLHDPRIAAVALGIAGRNGLEQALDLFFVAHLGSGPAPGVQIASLAERDQLLHDRA